MIQSTELAFRLSEPKGFMIVPDWNPVTFPFPEGVRPKVHKLIPKPLVEYKFEIPKWGAHLATDSWYVGAYGLWHPAFDAIPFHKGDLSKAFIIEKYSKAYFLEVSHRLWAYHDKPLNAEELELQEEMHLDPSSFRGKNLNERLMEMRRYKYHKKVFNEHEISKKEFCDPEQSLEGYYKFNKTKVLRSLKRDRPGTRRASIEEINNSAKLKCRPTPIFDKKGYWINKPNPMYKPEAYIQKDIVIKPVTPPRPKGRGRRLNKKLKAEGRRLICSLSLPKVKLDRNTLRKLRVFESHLLNIVHLSEMLYRVPKNRLSRIRRDLFLLISKIPFTDWGSKQRPSMKTLPPWARRIVSRNLKILNNCCNSTTIADRR